MESTSFIVGFFRLHQMSFSAEHATELQDAAMMGQRFLTINTVVRVRQIEVSRDVCLRPRRIEYSHAIEARKFSVKPSRNAWPGARITWALVGLPCTMNENNIASYES